MLVHPTDWILIRVVVVDIGIGVVIVVVKIGGHGIVIEQKGIV